MSYHPRMPLLYRLDAIAESVLPDPTRACRMLDVAKKLGVSIIKVENSELPAGALASIYGRRVFVRTDLGVIQARFFVAHEFAHLLGAESEIEADRIAAALVMPGPAMRHAVEQLGIDVQLLACVFQTSETAIVLRLGELRIVSAVAVIADDHVRARSMALNGLDEQEIVRRLDRNRATYNFVEMLRLTEPHRYALIAA